MNNSKIQFSETRGFQKDMKKLVRKFRTLPDDIENLKRALVVAHFTREIAPEDVGFFPVSHPDIPEGFFVAKKFACRALKGSGNRSGFRIVYHLHNTHFKICLIEIYHKNQKEVEDFQRIQDYLENENGKSL